MSTYTMQELESRDRRTAPGPGDSVVLPLRGHWIVLAHHHHQHRQRERQLRRQRQRQRGRVPQPEHSQRQPERQPRRQHGRPVLSTRSISPDGLRYALQRGRDSDQEGRPAAPGRPSSLGVISCGKPRPSSRPIPEGCRPMSAATQPVSTHFAAPGQPPGETPVSVASPPRLADGVELLGAYKNSAYSKPPSLVRRADGQVIQMSPLLYQVACRIDGSRGADAIAALVSADLGRSLDAEQVSYLITAKLLPLGIVADGGRPARPAEGQPAVRAKSAVYVAARAHRRTSSERSSARCSGGPSSWPWSAACWPWTTGCSSSTG